MNQEHETAGADLIAALRDPQCYPHAVGEITLLETHISWVVLTGTYAYKLKKPLKLPFLDFSTLELRKRYCDEELRINRALAPSLYLDVVAIRGTRAHPVIEGSGPVLEYAVRMRQFPQDALASRLVRRGALMPDLIVALAQDLADFHARTGVAAADTPHGSADCVKDQIVTVIAELEELLHDAADRSSLQVLRAWVEQRCARLHETLATRKREGYIRECHGDLHLGNVVLLEGRLTPFDGIEFNAGLRWIDVMSETAFLAMDLVHADRGDLASLFIDAYLERSGDYAGVALLRFYLVYRALVRVLARALRASQSHGNEDASAGSYLALAARYANERRGAIIVMHGLSGSGKSTVARELVQALAGLRVRSDVERKRMHGLDTLARTAAAVGGGVYDEQATAATYERLRTIAAGVAEAGIPVIVDAACLRRWQRDAFRGLATTLGVPFVIVSAQATHEVLRARIVRRNAHGTDASEANLDVLARQIAAQDPLAEDELRDSVIVDGALGLSDSDRERIKARL